MVGCGQTSAKWRPSTMRLPPSTGPSGSRERRSFAFVREDVGLMIGTLAHRYRNGIDDRSDAAIASVGNARSKYIEIGPDVGHYRHPLVQVTAQSEAPRDRRSKHGDGG